MANTRKNEVIFSKIKSQPQKENNLNFEKKNVKDYCFEDQVVGLERYLAAVRISHSGKVE